MFQTCFRLVWCSAYPGQNGPNPIKWVIELLVIAKGRKAVRGRRRDIRTTPNLLPNTAVPMAIHASPMPPKKRIMAPRQAAAPRKDRVQGGPAEPDMCAARHAGSFSVNTSPDVAESNANFDSVDSCKQKPPQRSTLGSTR